VSNRSIAIGRTPRSNPHLYRRIHAHPTVFKNSGCPAQGFKAGRFIQCQGGRCSPAAGRVARSKCTFCRMFMSPVMLPGKTLQPETLESVTGETIAEVLDMRSISRWILKDSGHSLPLQTCRMSARLYRLGQAATTLSAGGPAVKLSSELSKEGRKNPLYLDEPTTGLHVADIQNLLIF